MSIDRDRYLALDPLKEWVNPFQAAADLMEPQAKQAGAQGEEIIEYLRVLGERTPQLGTVDPLLILVTGRCAVNPEQRAFMRRVCDEIDKLIAEAAAEVAAEG